MSQPMAEHPFEAWRMLVGYSRREAAAMLAERLNSERARLRQKPRKVHPHYLYLVATGRRFVDDDFLEAMAVVSGWRVEDLRAWQKRARARAAGLSPETEAA